MSAHTESAPRSQVRMYSRGREGADRRVMGIAHVVLAIWAIIVIFPMLWTLMSSFKDNTEIISSPFAPPGSVNFDNYVTAWTQHNIGLYFINTVIVVGGALFLVMLLGAMCSYILARYEFPGRMGIYYLMLAGLTFPIFLAIVPLFFVMDNLGIGDTGIRDTLPGLIIVYVAFALPFTVFFLYAFFRSLPVEMSEAAQVDGAGHWRTFFQVMLPMAVPGMASVAIFNFLGLWNQFLLPVALNTKRDNWVLSQGIASFVSQAGYRTDFGSMFAAVVITVIPVLVIYVIFQRRLQGSVAQGTMK